MILGKPNSTRAKAVSELVMEVSDEYSKSLGSLADMTTIVPAFDRMGKSTGRYGFYEYDKY
eukprot:scaffold6366_cov67-Skeletonema_dohrnii-CCMP3373.AAC.1